MAQTVEKSVSNVEDLGPIPGLGRFLEEVRSLGWVDPLENGMATHSNFWPREFHGQRSLAG